MIDTTAFLGGISHAACSVKPNEFGTPNDAQVGTMLLGLVATEQREDAMHALEVPSCLAVWGAQ